MKSTKLANILLLISIVLIIINIVMIVKVLNMNKYDVNKDGTVNSKDMLDLRNYLIGETNE